MAIQDDLLGTHPTLDDAQSLSSPEDLPRGSNLGRYVIIEPIGSGGMGTVYRAYDPQLNRGVALKILSVKHADLQAAEKAKARLIREAQALAQLSHPNVVAVHDADAFGDDVFIAMELVEGETLDQWMRQKKRSIKEILEVMIAAGRGLSAAHQVGLVHRDFKPGNIMVGADGRVRVLDFGLARTAEQQESIEGIEKGEPDKKQKNPKEWKENSSDSSPNWLLSPLTRAGGVMGTPMYMAPEQHLGLKIDERTDQFGFSVVLYEVLYGKRPFVAGSMEKLKNKVIQQQVRVPSTDAEVPFWLWLIVSKGLSAKPEDRYRTMESLLEALNRDPEEERRQKRLVRRRSLTIFVLILLTIILPIGVWYGLRYRTVQLCKAAEGEFEGIWDEPTKAVVKTAFLDTKKGYAESTWRRVEGTTNRYLSQWKKMRSDSCEAKLLRATLSEELFDLRLNCLRKRKQELKALVNVYKKADEQIVQKAVQASFSLTDIKSCADEEALRASYPPPKTTEIKTKVAVVREKLANVIALENTGKYREGLQLVQSLKRESKAVFYQPVQAEILYRLGSLLEKTGEYQQAETVLHAAVSVAGEIRDSLLAAKGLVILVWTVGHRQARHEDGLSLSQYAKVMLSVAGGDERTQAKLLNNLGGMYRLKGDYNKALAYYRKASNMFESSLGSENPVVAVALNNLGVVYVDTGDFDTARIYYSKAQAIQEKTLGPDHPDIALTLNNLGALFSRKGEHNKAIEKLRKALSIKEKALGPEHPRVAYTLDCIGEVLVQKGEYNESKDTFRKSLEILEKSMGRNHPILAWPLSGIGRVLVNQGKLSLALEPIERALGICQQKTCALDPYGRALYSLARVDFETGRDKKRAIETAKKARDVFGKAANKFKKELEEVDIWLEKHSQDQ